MRFVLKNTRCVMCQQESPAVFVTRSMGTFTAPLPPEEFEKLSFKARKYFTGSREAGWDVDRLFFSAFDSVDRLWHS
jgi:hypothetical protein